MNFRHLFRWLAGPMLALVLILGPASEGCALELVMFRQALCDACTLWDKEVGQVYPKTRQGQQAPIRNVDIHDDRPGELADIGPVVYTPTFVLVEDGRELGRIIGYGGEDFFWGLLDQMLDRLPDPALRASLQRTQMRE